MIRHLVGALFPVLAMLPLPAQVNLARRTGIVTGPSGGVIPGAKVSVKSDASGVAAATTTNAAGVYLIPSLNPVIQYRGGD